SYTAVAGDTAARVVAVLAGLVNASADPDAAPYSAAANGARLYIVDRVLPALLGTTYTVAQGASAFPSQSATATVAIAIATSPAPVVKAGEAWVLTLISGGVVTSYSYTPTLATLQSVLDNLASLINSDAATPYTAVAGTNSLLVYRSGTAVFQTSLTVIPVGSPTLGTSARTALVALTGNPVAGEQWKLTLKDANLPAAGRTYTFNAGATTTLADIAADLAGQVSTDDANLPAYSATFQDGT